PFLKDTGTGWVSAEYSLLPYATTTRVPRSSSQSGRSQEIQRMIGRSLRGVTVLKALGERTLWVDCDVLQADGGTRTAAVTGAFLSLTMCLFRLHRAGQVKLPVLRDYLAGISVGVVQGQPLLDLDYSEDSVAAVDFNVVMTGRGELVEIQGTGEGRPFSREELERLLNLAGEGIKKIIAMERSLLGEDKALLFGQ
ncbi:MAG TPA: ribonuclease PH, partial [bacterium]|nr:ribonuclease PH [bacterium]